VADTKAPHTENKGVASNFHRLQKRQEKRMLNEGISLNIYENKHVIKLTWIKFTPNLECYRKTSYLRVRTLNVIERKGEAVDHRFGKTGDRRSVFKYGVARISSDGTLVSTR